LKLKKNDILWKGILEDLFDDFLYFFYGDAEKKELRFFKVKERICDYLVGY